MNVENVAKKKDEEDKWKDDKAVEQKFLLSPKKQNLLGRLVKDTKAKIGPHGGLTKRINKPTKDDEDFF
jgi:hypothetical protein